MVNNTGSYLTSRIKEALYNAQGNKAKAMQQIMAWCAQDSDLLKELTRAHLSGIVAYHVDRVTSGKAPQGSAPSAPVERRKPARKMVDPAQVNPFGEAILKAANNSKASVFGLESYEAPSKSDDDKTSQRHIDAMRHLASFSKPPHETR